MLNIRTILHPTDFSEPSTSAFHLACSLARQYQARLFVVHVEPPVNVYGELAALPPESPGRRTSLEDQLHRLQSPDAAASVEHRLLEGDPSSEILRLAEEIGCDLIVMGTHGRTGLRRLLLGSVAEEVLRQAPCPVLTVKKPVPEAVATTEEQHAPAPA